MINSYKKRTRLAVQVEYGGSTNSENEETIKPLQTNKTNQPNQNNQHTNTVYNN